MFEITITTRIMLVVYDSNRALASLALVDVERRYSS